MGCRAWLWVSLAATTVQPQTLASFCCVPRSTRTYYRAPTRFLDKALARGTSDSHRDGRPGMARGSLAAVTARDFTSATAAARPAWAASVEGTTTSGRSETAPVVHEQHRSSVPFLLAKRNRFSTSFRLDSSSVKEVMS